MSTFNDLITFTRSTTGTYLDSVVYGDELVVNGTFDTNLNGWSGAGWVWSNGKAYDSGASVTEGLEQIFTTVADRIYVIEYTLSGISGGTPSLKFEDQIVATHPTDVTNGRVIVRAAIINSKVEFIGGAATFSIDNVSVKEVIGGQVSGTPLLRTAAINEPRLEYDAQGNALGLLIEEARTNLLSYSQEFDDNYWTKTNATVTANQIAAPDGTNTGYKVNENAATTPHYILQTGFSFTSGEEYTQSVYAKAGTNNIVQLLGTSAAFGSQAWANFDLSDGTIGSKGTATAAAIQSVGEGWYRCSITITVTATSGGSAGLTALVPTKTSSRVFAYEGNPSNHIYAWGAQVELGSFPTSYIPTSGSTVTRAVDSAVATLSNFYYRQKNGSMFVEFTSKYDESAALFNRVYELGNAGTSINRIMTYVKTDETRLSCSVWDNNVFQAGTTLTTPLPNGTGVYSKAAYAWETNNARAALDGNLVGSVDTSVSLTQTRDTLGIMRGADSTSQTLTGYIKSIQYYPLRLADARLETLT